MSTTFRPDLFTAETIKYDLHSHLLPGVDDGVRNPEDGLQLIEGLIKLGYAGAVTTPHIYPEVFDNTEEGLRCRFKEFSDLVKQYFPDFSLDLGAEYYLDEHLISKIINNPFDLLMIGKQRRWILVEFPTLNPPLNVHDLFLVCQRQHWQPIIAHVERYDYIQKEKTPVLLKEWIRQGALLQMDLGSVVGQYGSRAAETADALLKQQGYHFIGTDLHHPRQWERYSLPAWNLLKKNKAYFFDEKKHHLLL